MRSKPQKSVLVGVLLLTAVGVWGFNAWQLFATFETGTVGNTPPSNRHPVLNPNTDRPEPVVYVAKGRDPFEYPRPVTVTRPPDPVRQTPEEIRLPVFTVQGVIDGTLILAEPSGTQHMVRVGEQFMGIELLAIHRDSVSLRYRERRFTHRFQP